VAALQRGLSAARREADGSVSTTKYMQARGPHRGQAIGIISR